MSETLSREALLEYVKKQKQKIKKLEQDLSAERDRTAASQYSTTIPDLSALQDEISGGISAFFGISAATPSVEPTAARNTDAAESVESLKALLVVKDTELTANIQKEKKFKVMIKTKMKEIEEKEKEIKQFQEIIAVQRSNQGNESPELSDSLVKSLNQQVVDLSLQLQNAKQEGAETKKEHAAATKCFTTARYIHHPKYLRSVILLLPTLLYDRSRLLLNEHFGSVTYSFTWSFNHVSTSSILRANLHIEFFD